MIEHLHDYAIPAAYAVLPAPMKSEAATAMLLAIALQESKARYRHQLGGPARGFWQFEAGGGVQGVLTHPATQMHARSALNLLCYPASLTVNVIHGAIEHNDALAAVFARLLLWSLPQALPVSTDDAGAWDQYMAAWRPGRPHRSTWAPNYAVAWSMVQV